MARDRQEGVRVFRSDAPNTREPGIGNSRPSLVDLEKIARGRERELDPKAWRFFQAARQARIQSFITNSEALVRRYGH